MPTFVGVPVTDAELAHRHGRSAVIENLKLWGDLVGASAGIPSFVLQLEAAAIAGSHGDGSGLGRRAGGCTSAKCARDSALDDSVQRTLIDHRPCAAVEKAHAVALAGCHAIVPIVGLHTIVDGCCGDVLEPVFARREIQSAAGGDAIFTEDDRDTGIDPACAHLVEQIIYIGFLRPRAGRVLGVCSTPGQTGTTAI